MNHKEFNEQMNVAWIKYLDIRNPIVTQTQLKIAAARAEEDKVLTPHLHEYQETVTRLMQERYKIPTTVAHFDMEKP